MSARHPALRVITLLLLVFGLLAGASASEVQLVASGGDTSDSFGGGGLLIGFTGGPGIAASGDVVVVGCIGSDFAGQGNQGSATVFRWNGATWVEGQTLTSSVGDGNDLFGFSVGICGPVIVVGAPYDDVAGVTEQGSATVFRWNGALWIEEQTLTASSGEASDGFGTSVSVSGDVIVVGAVMDDVAGATDQGSATVFRWNGTSWVEEQTLTAGDGEAFDNFGTSVSASGYVIGVGVWLDDPGGMQDAGSARVFRWNGSSWVEEQTLTPLGGAAFDAFGMSVSVSGDVLVAGAPFDEVGGFNGAGSATVFRWNGAAWVEEQTLTATGGATFDYLGASVAVKGLVIVAGALFDDVDSQLNEGSATVFRWDGAGWAEDQTLTASLGAPQDNFGATVAVEGEAVFVGAPQTDVGSHGNQGVAYVYDLPATPWSHQGAGLAGVFGDPLLDGAGDLTGGALTVVDLSLAAPSATAALFLGFSGASVPFKGGILKPFPFLPPLFVTTSPSGTLPLVFGWPVGIPAGTELWIQWAMQDAAAVFGVSLSNAVRGVSP